MTIPFSEISLTGILQFPVFIPSPIGMELTEISISLVRFWISLSKREATNREKAFKLFGKVGEIALKTAKVSANIIMKVVVGLAKDDEPSRKRRKWFGLGNQ
jgi:hypothetical protein